MDKAHRRNKYIPYEVLEFNVHEEVANGILREIRTADTHMLERVTFDRPAGLVTFTLVDHPIYEGAITNPGFTAGEWLEQSVVTYTMDLKPRRAEAEKSTGANWVYQRRETRDNLRGRAASEEFCRRGDDSRGKRIGGRDESVARLDISVSFFLSRFRWTSGGMEGHC